MLQGASEKASVTGGMTLIIPRAIIKLPDQISVAKTARLMPVIVFRLVKAVINDVQNPFQNDLLFALLGD